MSKQNQVRELRGKEQFRRKLREQRLSGAFLDTELNLSNGTTIKAHACVLAAHCEFFQNALDKTKPWSEGKTGVIDLPDDPPEAINVIVNCFYGDEESLENFITQLYDPEISNDECWEILVDVYLVAEKYCIDEVKLWAKCVLKSPIFWKFCTYDEIITVAQKIYDSTYDRNHPLRIEIVRGARSWPGGFLDIDKVSLDYIRWRLIQNPEFILDIASGRGEVMEHDD